jgi:hypothetical protein
MAHLELLPRAHDVFDDGSPGQDGFKPCQVLLWCSVLLQHTYSFTAVKRADASSQQWLWRIWF